MWHFISQAKQRADKELEEAKKGKEPTLEPWRVRSEMTKNLSSRESKCYVRSQLTQAMRLWSCWGTFMNNGSRCPRNKTTFLPVYSWVIKYVWDTDELEGIRTCLTVHPSGRTSGTLSRHRLFEWQHPAGSPTSTWPWYNVLLTELCSLIMKALDLKVGRAWRNQVCRKISSSSFYLQKKF